MAKSGLVVAQRKFLPRAVSPACKDTFDDDKTTCVFTRGHGGKVGGVSLSLARVHTAHVRPRAVSRAPVFLSKSLQLMISRVCSRRLGLRLTHRRLSRSVREGNCHGGSCMTDKNGRRGSLETRRGPHQAADQREDRFGTDAIYRYWLRWYRRSSVRKSRSFAAEPNSTVFLPRARTSANPPRSTWNGRVIFPR
jgi:hypothetical protein